MSRTTLTVDGFPQQVRQGFELNLEAAGAGFHRYTLAQLLRFRGPFNISTIGACSVLQFRGDTFDDADAFGDASTGLEAGDMTVTGPAGSQTIQRIDVGVYFQSLGTGIPGFPVGLPGILAALPDSQNQTGGFFVPGDYMATLSGGSDVGALTATITVPEKPVTNLESIDVVPRDQPLRITYSGASSAQWVWISGTSIINAQTDPQGAVFLCRAPPDTGSFDVPSAILSLLPPSDFINALKGDGAGVNQSIPTGFLLVGLGLLNTFTASGLDQGTITHTDTDMRAVEYR